MTELIVTKVFTAGVILRNQRDNARLQIHKMQHDTNLSASGALTKQASMSRVDVGNVWLQL